MNAKTVLWSMKLNTGSLMTFVPPGAIRITNVAIGREIRDPFERTTVQLHYREPNGGAAITVLTSLLVGKYEQCIMDVLLEEGAEYAFEIIGTNLIYLTGTLTLGKSQTSRKRTHDSDVVSLSLASVTDNDPKKLAEVSKSVKRSKKKDAPNAMASNPQAVQSPSTTISDQPQEAFQTPAAMVVSEKAIVKTLASAASIKVQDIKPGTGREVQNGDTVKLRFIGRLNEEGKELSKKTIYDRNVQGDPLSFCIGSREVIQGFDDGVLGMRAGGERRIYVPAELAYGNSGNGVVPGNVSLSIGADPNLSTKRGY